jgi:hypothetical protein
VIALVEPLHLQLDAGIGDVACREDERQKHHLLDASKPDHW